MASSWIWANPVETVVHYLPIGGMTILAVGMVFHGECTIICDAHWIGPMMNHDVRLSIFMIHQATILHEFSTLRGYLAYIKINRRLWPRGKNLKWAYIPMNWVTIDGCWWQHVLLIETPWYPMGFEIVCPFGWSKGHVIMKSMPQ